MLFIYVLTFIAGYTSAQFKEKIEEIPTEITAAMISAESNSPTDSYFHNSSVETTIPPDSEDLLQHFSTLEGDKTTILFSNFYTLSPFTDEEQPLKTETLQVEHPCKRKCNGKIMSCRYTFKVENYYVMSKACYDCPLNLTDCYLKDCIHADGVKRKVTVVNRMLPGPSIEVCEGDEVIVDLENLLSDGSTTLHWHGQHQARSPYMDGVPFVTQCPISPKSKFRYKFKAETPGTHFWHSHIGQQRADGVFGPLIVRRVSELHSSLYDLDLSSHVILVQDWTHKSGDEAFSIHHHSNGKNKPDNILVNGRGRHRKNRGENLPPLSTFSVKKGLKYRFRLINNGVLNCPIQLSIDNHTILAISTDGSDIEPVKVDSLISYAGERWDFVLNAKAPIGNYWMRFRGLMDCDERFTMAHSASILHYENADLIFPLGEISYENSNRIGIVLNPLNVDCTTALCMNNINASNTVENLNKDPDKHFIFAYDFYPLDNPMFHKSAQYAFSNVKKGHSVYTPQLNHISLRLPSFPLLSQYNKLKKTMLCSSPPRPECSSNYCECTNIVDIKSGDLVEIILIDIGETYDANHPFHLHGHSFSVVATGKLGKSTSVDKVESLDEKGLILRNLINPVIKDTVNVPDGGYAVIRFTANNPGYWLFHCHLEWHAELGMALVFKVGEHTEFPPVPQGFPKCGDYLPDDGYEIDENEIDAYVTYVGNPVINNINNPFSKWTNTAPIMNKCLILFFFNVVVLQLVY